LSGHKGGRFRAVFRNKGKLARTHFHFALRSLQ
jgi:hypothetical protein